MEMRNTIVAAKTSTAHNYGKLKLIQPERNITTTDTVFYCHTCYVLRRFYPRDDTLARVFATATCLSVCLSVCHTPVLCLAERKQDREMYTI